MSVRESLHVHHPVDVAQFLQILTREFGAQQNSEEPHGIVLGNPPLPCYTPQLINGEYLSVVSFNYLPLPEALLLALATHPELAPPETRVTWLAEQDVLAEGTLAEFKNKLATPNDDLIPNRLQEVAPERL